MTEIMTFKFHMRRPTPDRRTRSDKTGNALRALTLVILSLEYEIHYVHHTHNHRGNNVNNCFSPNNIMLDPCIVDKGSNSTAVVLQQEIW